MHETPAELTVAIDGGTTNTRVRLLRSGKLLAAAVRPVGVRNVAMTGSSEPLRQALAGALMEVINSAGCGGEQLDMICASGMVTSNVGLHEVPHVAAPAGIVDLARNVQCVPFPDIARAPIRLIPGVKTLPAAGEQDPLSGGDIMRGEECETLGILEATSRQGPLCLLLPGSHTKLVYVNASNQIAASYTTVAGELMQAMAERTVLAGSVEWPPASELDWQSIQSGAEFAKRWGLLRGGFAVRLSDILLKLDRQRCTWFFIGLVAATDIGDLTRWSAAKTDIPLLVGGREPLRSVYGELLNRDWIGPVEVLPSKVVDLAAARGAIAVAGMARGSATFN
jgi:2-dehydro-3-deoxygalactonokinase